MNLLFPGVLLNGHAALFATLLLLVNVKRRPPDAIISHCCSILTYSIVHRPAASWPCISCFTPLPLPLYATAIVFAIPSSLLPLCLQKCSAAVVYQSQPRSYLVLIPSLPSSQFAQSPFFFFTTSSFLSLSPLIYLSRWAATRSDALPLCLCCVCVICIPCLPQWNSLVCLRPQWLHPNLSLCWLSQGPGHQGLHFRKGERALCGSVASWCGCYYHGPTLLAFIPPPQPLTLFPHLKMHLLFCSISIQLLVSSQLISCCGNTGPCGNIS